jgi:hypothetical protein
MIRLFFLAGLLACSPDPSPTAAPEAPSTTADGAATPGHAPAGAEPGSHADWCGEHAVPESLCTRCSPDLIPAFKATGDWCDTHGLPQSQCTACDPGLVIERPPKDG